MTAGADPPSAPHPVAEAMPVLGVCGHSGSGKTTLLVETIRLLVARGLKVAAIKHVSHTLQPDTPGKDSDRLFTAGATVVAAAADQALARWRPGDRGQLFEQLDLLAGTHDLVLVEGHSRMPIPKVWLSGPRRERPPDDIVGLLATWPPDQATPQRLAELAIGRAETALRQRPVVGAVLIGGASRRMGRPKPLLTLRGKSLLEHVVEALRTATNQVVLLGGGPVPEALSGLPRLPDPPGLDGPLAGLLAAMRWHPGACWLLAACDQPRITPQAVGWLLDQRRLGRWAVLPRLSAERIEPLPGVYEPQARLRLEAHARRGVFSLQALTGDARFAHPPVPPELCRSWQNINTPADYQALREGDGVT